MVTQEIKPVNELLKPIERRLLFFSLGLVMLFGQVFFGRFSYLFSTLGSAYILLSIMYSTRKSTRYYRRVNGIIGAIGLGAGVIITISQISFSDPGSLIVIAINMLIILPITHPIKIALAEHRRNAGT